MHGVTSAAGQQPLQMHDHMQNSGCQSQGEHHSVSEHKHGMLLDSLSWTCWQATLPAPPVHHPGHASGWAPAG